MNDLLQIAAIILGNSGLVVLLEKSIESKSKTRKTIKALCYNTLSDKLNSIIMKNYATETDRRDVHVLWSAYHNEGWNGDMDDRMNRVMNLPYHPDEEMKVKFDEEQIN